MKLTVSIPEPLAEALDALTRLRRTPRSRIVATAVADYLARQSPSNVTERLDVVYAHARAAFDPDLERNARLLLGGSAW